MLHLTFSGLQINDIFFPLSFAGFGGRSGFLALLLLPFTGGPKDGNHFYTDCNWGLIFSAGFHTSPDHCEWNLKWKSNTIETVTSHCMRHGCGWGDLRELSFVKQNVLLRCVSKPLNEQGHPRTISEKYLFEDYLRSRVFGTFFNWISCLPTSIRIFESQTWYDFPFLTDFYPKKEI